MPDAFDPATLAFYAAEAPVYVTARPDHIGDELPDFLDQLHPGASILELGCGSGIDAQHMIARGFDVDPTDGVPEMAALASKRLGQAVRVMRFDQLSAVDEYDAVIAIASLLHVPRGELGGVLRRVYRALKPGGVHLATFKADSQEGADEHGRYYNYPTMAFADKLYRQAGDWDSLAFEEAMGVGYFSKPAKWLKVIAQK